jgi:hypothetical protein
MGRIRLVRNDYTPDYSPGFDRPTGLLRIANGSNQAPVLGFEETSVDPGLGIF